VFLDQFENTWTAM